jgi:hypothetical protein
MNLDRHKLRKMSIEERLTVIEEIWETIEEDATPEQRRVLLDRLDDEEPFQLTPEQQKECYVASRTWRRTRKPARHGRS